MGVIMKDNILLQNKQSWNTMAGSWMGSTALPVYGCLIPTEEELGLFPDLSEKKVLDIGCGSGHSLKWCGDKGASELWGLDLSSKQIDIARQFLCDNNYEAKLFNSPMEVSCGLPAEYFDVVYSIYAIGWTVDLETTFHNVASYLKKDGVFIFSWDHPLMHCLEANDNSLMFKESYLMEEDFSYAQRGNPVTIKNRKLSTYINSLAEAGFLVERLVEETDRQVMEMSAPFQEGYYTPYKAKNFPLSFIIKARKL